MSKLTNQTNKSYLFKLQFYEHVHIIIQHTTYNNIMMTSSIWPQVVHGFRDANNQN